MKFTYYQHHTTNLFYRSNGAGTIEGWNVPDSLIKGWVPVFPFAEGIRSVCVQIGIRQLPSSARNASYTQTA